MKLWLLQEHRLEMISCFNLKMMDEVFSVGVERKSNFLFFSLN